MPLQVVLGNNWKNAEYNSADIHGGACAFMDGANTVYRFEIVAQDGATQGPEISISKATDDWQSPNLHYQPLTVSNLPANIATNKLYGFRNFAPNMVNGVLRLVGEALFVNNDAPAHTMRLVSCYIDGLTPALYGGGGGSGSDDDSALAAGVSKNSADIGQLQSDVQGLKNLTAKMAGDAEAIYERVGADETAQKADEASIAADEQKITADEQQITTLETDEQGEGTPPQQTPGLPLTIDIPAGATKLVIS